MANRIKNLNWVVLFLLCSTVLKAENVLRPAQNRKLASLVNEEMATPTPSERDWWIPRMYNYSVGYEASGGSLPSPYGKNAVSFGVWWSDSLGYELLFGYTKSADTTNAAETTTDNALTSNRTVSTVYSGTKGAHEFIGGTVIKYRLFQNDWFQFNAGAVIVVYAPTSATYPTGTIARTYPDRNDPNNYTVSETSYGETSVKQALKFGVGPRLGTEFYIKWFPHLALGFSTGVLTSFGGTTTTVTTTRTRSYLVQNGVEQPASPDTPTTVNSETSPGMSGSTFGFGGTFFSFTGNFSIRYVW